MNKSAWRRRAAGRGAARTLAMAAMAALLATLSAGPALATPDERVLERQGMIRRQADERAKATEPSPAPSARYPRPYLRPEPPIHTGPPLDPGQQAPPDQAPAAPADRTGLVVALAVGALLLAVGAAAARSLRPPPERPA